MYFSFGYSVKLHPWQLSRAEIHSLCRQSANLFLKYFLQFGVMSGSLAFWRRKVVPSTWCHRLWQGIAKWSDSFSFFMISLSHVTPSSPQHLHFYHISQIFIFLIHFLKTWTHGEMLQVISTHVVLTPTGVHPGWNCCITITERWVCVI